jgi:hypothetical protein
VRLARGAHPQKSAVATGGGGEISSIVEVKFVPLQTSKPMQSGLGSFYCASEASGARAALHRLLKSSSQPGHPGIDHGQCCHCVALW